MGCIALVRCVLVLRRGLAGVVWCGIRMQAEALVLQLACWAWNNEIKKGSGIKLVSLYSAVVCLTSTSCTTPTRIYVSDEMFLIVIGNWNLKENVGDVHFLMFSTWKCIYRNEHRELEKRVFWTSSEATVFCSVYVNVPNLTLIYLSIFSFSYYLCT